jgi:hypothetical protein
MLSGYENRNNTTTTIGSASRDGRGEDSMKGDFESHCLKGRRGSPTSRGDSRAATFQETIVQSPPAMHKIGMNESCDPPKGFRCE